MKLNKNHLIIGIIVILLLSFFNTNSQSSIEKQLVGVWKDDEGTYLEFFENGLGGSKSDLFQTWNPEISWSVEDNTLVLDLLSDGTIDYTMEITSNDLSSLQFIPHRDNLNEMIGGQQFQKIQD